MPDFCRHGSLIKKGYFILLDLSKSMIFHKNQITFMRFCDPRYFVLIKLISPCCHQKKSKIPYSVLPSIFDCCRRKNSLKRNFIPKGFKNWVVLFEFYSIQNFQNHHLNLQCYGWPFHKSTDLKFHSGNKKKY